MRVTARLSVAAPAAALVSVLALSCATNPVTGKRELSLMSEAQEIGAGQQMDPEIRAEMGLYDDAELQRYVEQIGLRLARNSERPNLPWHFAVVDAPAVNAFALPGGYIYITRGILAYIEDEAQLAGVLAHEIGHVAARHSAQQYTRATLGQVSLLGAGIFVPRARPLLGAASTALGVAFLKFGRDDELQADQLGARYAATNGWDPAGVPELLETLSRISAATDRAGVPNWLSTHPNPDARVERVEGLVKELTAGRAQGRTARDEYLRRIDGMVFGDNPKQGLVRGGRFLHPDLRFALRFPESWKVNNSASSVVAEAPGGNALMLLQLARAAEGGNPRAAASAQMSKAGFTEIEGGAADINGLNAYVGVYRGTIEGAGPVAMRAAHIAHGGRVYLVAGLASPEAFAQADPVFQQSIRSFERLSAAEAADIHPNRVDLYVVRPGDQWEAIARRSGGAADAATIAIMNGRTPADPPPVGERIKIVVGG
jgi:predicted Zn-dependent protease